MYIHISWLFIYTFAVVSSTNLRNRMRRDGESGRNKNYDLCSRVFDVSNSTIIKTSESVKNGARYLGATRATTKDACERNCCSTDSCNVAVLENGGDCFLFDCGSLDHFKCSFAVHSNYVSLGMMVNRVDLEKTRLHEQTKHEMDLKILKTPSDQPDAVPVVSATTMAAPNENDKEQQQRYPDDRNTQLAPDNFQQQPNAKMNLAQQQDVGTASANQQQPADMNVMTPYDYPQQSQQQRQFPDMPVPRQNVPLQRIPQDRPLTDSSNLLQQQGNSIYDQDSQRKQVAMSDNSNLQPEKITKPKALMNSKIEQPQRPPIFPDQRLRQNGRVQNCNSYQWACSSGNQCIAIYDRCSGIVQCADGSDEQNCDQVLNLPNDRLNYGNGNNANDKSSLSGAGQQGRNNGGSWSDYYKSNNVNSAGDQQNNIQRQSNQQNVDRFRNNGQEQQRPFGDNLPQKSQQSINQQIPFQGDKQQPSENAVRGGDTNVVELSTKKESRVEFISVQKLDSSASIEGNESASLAIIMLGLGIAILSLLLLFLSCRLRKLRRRVRRGKVLDTEEGEFLVSGMYL